MYFFLLSPNNSGSTVVAQFLASYMKDAYLPREGTNESQNLPEIRRLIGRRQYGWNEHESLPWPEIDSLLRQRAASESKNWIIEKTRVTSSARTKFTVIFFRKGVYWMLFG